jgi:predicted Zn-dependent protease
MAKSPTYYTRGVIEVWDFIRDQELNYHLGCAIKYICRAGYKGSKAEDLIKAIHYLENELENVIAKQSSDRISQSLRYKELLECEGETEVFDR